MSYHETNLGDIRETEEDRLAEENRKLKAENERIHKSYRDAIRYALSSYAVCEPDIDKILGWVEKSLQPREGEG